MSIETKSRTVFLVSSVVFSVVVSGRPEITKLFSRTCLTSAASSSSMLSCKGSTSEVCCCVWNSELLYCLQSFLKGVANAFHSFSQVAVENLLSYNMHSFLHSVRYAVDQFVPQVTCDYHILTSCQSWPHVLTCDYQNFSPCQWWQHHV